VNARNINANIKYLTETTKISKKINPLSQSDLINYGLHLIRLAESNIKEANTFISTVTIEPKQKDKCPF